MRLATASRRRRSRSASLTLALGWMVGLAGVGAGVEPAEPVPAPVLIEILQRHLEAVGGEAAWGRLRSVRMTGTVGLGPDITAPVTILAERPRKYRIEFIHQDKVNINAYDGSTGWSLMPILRQSQPVLLPEGETRSLWELADFDGVLVNADSEGTAIRLVGQEDLEGRPVVHLDLTLASGDVRQVFLDAESHLLVRVTGSFEAQGAAGELDLRYGDYRAVAGVQVAHRLEERFAEGDFVRITRIEAVDFNVELADDLFAAPPGVAIASGQPTI